MRKLQLKILMPQHQTSRRHLLVKIPLELITSLLIVLWLYTGINKLLDYEETLVQMGRSPFIAGMAGFLHLAIPIGEIMLALLLAIKRTRLLALYGSLFLMTLFTGYIYMMLNFSYDLPCSCGGVLRELSWHDHLLFNGLFTLFCAAGILLAEENLSTP